MSAPGPNPAQALMMRAHQLVLDGRAREAREAIETATGIPGLDLEDAVVVSQLAEFFARLQAFEEARHFYARQTRLQPASSLAWYNLATVEHYLGDIASAEQSADRAIELDPDNDDAWFLRSGLRRQTEADNHIDALRARLERPIASAEHFAKASFALAKELEDCGRYVESFEARSQGAARYRASLDYDFEEDLAFVNQIAPSYPAERFAQVEGGHDNDEAIFIVGLPRTGTTLLERVVGGHDDVFIAGELTHFTHAMVAQMEHLGVPAPASRAEMVELSTGIDFAALGRDYIERTRPATGRTPRFIDKFPQNCLYAGLIHLALPRARILLLERHPLDVCYAVYKQLFTEIYQFSYDLEELAGYYIAWWRLMQHWREVLPDAIRVVRYEDLVNDLEAQARGALEFCGLDWQPQVLEFHRGGQASTTASAAQVRQKVYTSSIGLWRNYAKQLQPLIDRLDAAGCLDGW